MSPLNSIPSGAIRSRSGRRGFSALAVLAFLTVAGGTAGFAQDMTPPAPAQVEQPAPQPQAPTAPAAPDAVQQQPAVRTEPIELQPGEEQGSTLPHDLSPWGMFMAADWVVKAVMIGLAFASLVTWTVWIAKSLELAGARGRARRVLRVVLGARTLDDAFRQTEKQRGPSAAMIRSAREEARLSVAALDHASASGLKERVGSRLTRLEVHAGRRMSMGTGVLATIGSTSPFVGLFGTVWGIMNSFIGISQAQTTNLAVVAPGIAEALLATALGLVAAIPAVVIYNVFARSITGYRQLLADVSAGVERLVSRDLDFRLVPGSASNDDRKARTAAQAAAE
ncbi:tonB-system energizer ExbB [Oryzicola mucosus]|uniref:Biopolymer transport protein ExbB n=1 Tax=Oryzicola mucosus TaxID=2767425 RepID=A0A8J6U6X8_9HYPH|nr:tonB-system energizer ExbB [Oryzicola mucosus]MBD0413952.1 tonB-system energizer ExbB [Oryzicola mucosus]